MKLLISNQHGAVVMALMPFLYGMLLSQPIWQHLFLFLAWLALYLMSYPFLQCFKGRNLAFYQKWTKRYAIASGIFAFPALCYNGQIIYFAFGIGVLSLISIYFVKQKQERALLNDFNGIAIFTLAGMAAYYFPECRWDHKIYWVAIYPSLFFVGTTFYVKSVLRERKNPYYLRIAILYHLLLVAVLIVLQQTALALTFVPALIRAMYLPRKKLSVMQIGLIEMGLSCVFFIMLLWATL